MSGGIQYKLDTKHLDALGKKVPHLADRVLGRLAGEMDGSIKAHFSRTAPNPSKPGRSPAVQTGKLKNSVSHQRIKYQTWETTEGGSEAPYARALEFGTRKMAARPHFRRAFDGVIARAPKMLVGAIKGLK